MSTEYDVIYLADDEWGNELMRSVAEAHFAEHPDVDFVEVYEHAGWFLGYRRDGSMWCTANDAAVLPPGPRPAKARHFIRRQKGGPIYCATCGEESGGQGTSMYGECHKHGPTSHQFVPTIKGGGAK